MKKTLSKMSKSFLNNHTSRGLRNNNPANLKLTSIAWQGKIPNSENKDTDKTFEQFKELKYGIRAMFKDLINDISKGKNTVKKLISEFAPPSENDTKSYIKKVCSSIGVAENDKITKVNRSFLLLLARAILTVELGKHNKEVTDADLNEGIDILGDSSTSALTVNISSLSKYLPAFLFLAFFF
jgi:hypothetical protein